VDLLKAVGIVAVVLIHCVRPSWDPGSSRVELGLASATLFAVPGFLAASGILQATAKRVPAAVTLARLRRLLVPYLIAAVAAQLYGLLVDGRPVTPLGALHDLLLAGWFGQYYYVLIAVLFVLVVPALARLGRRSLVAVTGAAVLSQWAVWIFRLPLPVSFGEEPFFWLVRNPLRWLGFFLAGWWFRRCEATVSPWLAKQRVSVCLLGGAVALAAATLAFRTQQPWLVGALKWLNVAAVLLLIVTLAARRPSGSRVLRHLSESTYTIYLFHLFFVYPMQRLFPPTPGVFEPIPLVAPWMAGVLGPLLLAAAGRALLGGPRGRAILGS
jgi:fucose 4-O-acetylase-like acetyltransferase